MILALRGLFSLLQHEVLLSCLAAVVVVVVVVVQPQSTVQVGMVAFLWITTRDSVEGRC